jgi:hypothetical protein
MEGDRSKSMDPEASRGKNSEEYSAVSTGTNRIPFFQLEYSTKMENR